MMARSARPVLESVCVSPVEMDKTEISTATTPAIPTTMTNEEVARAGRLRKFIAVTATICFKVLMKLSLSARERVDDFQPPGPPGRRQPACQRQEYRNGRAPTVDRRRHPQPFQSAGGHAGHDDGKSRCCCEQTKSRREQTQQQRFDEYQGQ